MLQITLLFLLPIALFGSSWAEETLSRMTLQEKIGQLFIAPACPLRGEDHWEDWANAMEKYHIGSAIMKQSNPESHVQFINRLQTASKFPMLITADAEWGLAMRIKDTVSFPRNQVLGEIGDLALIREIGVEIGRECKRVGIHLNFAPVADANTNPDNPVIGSRSFGSDPHFVAKCVVQMLEGLQEGGVMACAKHFPGHGDTSIDSHWDLPIILHDRNRLDNVELVPFKAALEHGVKAVMSAHILVPCLDPRLPATLSFNIIHKLLREEMGFDGLIVTDALNMRALSNFYTPEEIAVHAHLAGCDLLLYGDHKGPNIDDILHRQIPNAHVSLCGMYETGILDVSFLDDKVLRILRIKEEMQLHLQRHVEEENLRTSLHMPEVLDLQELIARKRDPQ